MEDCQPTRHVNILILGETGVGKSTWINSFANYLAFNTLEEAEQNEFVTVIPASFTITDDDYQERIITTGEDRNEVLRAGESATQRPRTYKFGYNNNSTIITLIDTPGIGDSRGPAQDKLNFQMIMDHLAYHKEVHGICILMKPNNARLTVLFEFCLKHLLTHLHRDAIKNIVFCFTNARNTFYRPGNTLPALKALLANYKDLELPLSKETMYCLDNESFQFLVAVQQGINFDDQRDIYSKSWEISSKETHRLLDHVLQLEPHQLQNTLSINDARRVVIGLTKPLADIASNIQQNISVAKDKQAEIQSAKADRSEMVQKMYIPVVQSKMVWLKTPVQVCQNARCCQAVTLGTGEKAYRYNCKKEANPAPNGGITDKLRRLMRPSSCSRCKCPKAKHAILDYDVVEEWTQQQMPGLEEKLQRMDGDVEAIRTQFLTGLLERIKNLEEEQVKIIQVCSMFAFFLKTNAIAPYNDTMIRYLEQNIEKVKLDHQPNQAELERLEKMKEDYRREVEILEENMAKAANVQDLVKCTDIPVLKEQLISLPLNGPKIKETLVQQEKRFTAGEEEFDEEQFGQQPKSGDKKKKFEKQASLAKSAEKRVGKFFGVFQNPSKGRPPTAAPPALPPRVPPSLPPKPVPATERPQEAQPRSSLGRPIGFENLGRSNANPGNNQTVYTSTAKPNAIHAREVPVQVKPVVHHPVSTLRAEQPWIPGQPTRTTGNSLGFGKPEPPPASAKPPSPFPVRSPLQVNPVHTQAPLQPQQPVGKPVAPPAPVRPVSSPTATAAPVPPPPPPPPALELPIPVGTGQVEMQQRSALMDDIRSNKLKLKPASAGTTGDKVLGSPAGGSTDGPLSLDAALKRALMDHFRANHGSVRDSVDEWA